jgi:hypothetical protein
MRGGRSGGMRGVEGEVGGVEGEGWKGDEGWKGRWMRGGMRSGVGEVR